MADISVANGGQAAAQALVTPNPKTTPLVMLLSTIQQQLNDNVQGYPQTAAAMAAAVGYGTWTAGWLLNIASGNDTGAFGGVTLTAAGTPLYGIAGPKGGIDLAVGVDAAADQFTGGDTFDVDGTQDLCVAWVAKFTANAADEFLFVKGNSGAARWGIYRPTAANTVQLELVSASGVKTAAVSTASVLGVWHVGIAVVDRGGNTGRVALCPLGGSPVVSSTTTLFAETMANADNFTVLNRNVGLPALTSTLAAAYIGVGVGAAANMSANLSTAVQSLANAINASWSLSLSPTTGQVSIGYTTPPAGVPSWSMDWTNTSLRDLLGFPRNINYPATAAALLAQIKFGDWTNGAGYLLNEASGYLASAFGTPATLTAVSTPTYGAVGPRGGADKAIGFDSTLDAFDGGANFDPAGNDLIVAWVGKFSALPSANRALISKTAALADGWAVWVESTVPQIVFSVVDGGGRKDVVLTGGASFYVGDWHVGIAVVDRSTGKVRVGIRSLTTGASAVATETTASGSITSSASFTIGASTGGAGFSAATIASLSGVYIVSGAGVATGLSANLSTALSNFAATFAQTQTGSVRAFAGSDKYASMLASLLPPGKAWRL